MFQKEQLSYPSNQPSQLPIGDSEGDQLGASFRPDGVPTPRPIARRSPEIDVTIDPPDSQIDGLKLSLRQYPDLPERVEDLYDVPFMLELGFSLEEMSSWG